MNSQPEALPRRTLMKGAVALGGITLLAACGKSADKPTSSAVTVTDQRDSVLRLDGPAKRIVTIPFPAAAIVIAVDQSVEHLVGMNNFSWTAARDSVLASFFPDVLDVEHDVARETFAPNIESVLELDPDVVVQWSSQGDEIIKPLENAHLPVLGVEYGTLDDVETWLAMFSQMLGKPARGKAMASRLEGDRDDIAEVARRRTGTKPTVLYFLRFAEGLTVMGTETFNDEYIRLVGCENAASSVKGATEVGLEQVLSWDPDIVLVGNFDDGMPDDIYGDPRWKDISAVVSRRVYKVPLGGYRWDPPSHESPLMWNWLSAVAFPGGETTDLRAKIDDDYQFFYGTAPTPSQVDSILRLDINGSSASYGQFRAS